MKSLVLALTVALAAPIGPAQARERAPATGGPLLAVAALMRNVEQHKGPLRVEGLVRKVFPKEQRLGLIDAAEFKKCGMVSACCDNQILPVVWTGPMPEVKTVVRLEGEVREAGGKLEFVARSLEKVPAK